MTESSTSTSQTPATAETVQADRSLRRRLMFGVLAIVLIASSLIGALSTIALRHSLLQHLDQQVIAASERASDKRNDDTDQDFQGTAPTGNNAGTLSQTNDDDAELQTNAEAPASADASSQTYSSNSAEEPATAPSMAANDIGADNGLGIVAPGLDAIGQSVGTLSLVKFAGDGTTIGGYIDDSGVYQSLSDEEISALLELSVTNTPVTVEIESLGAYRVLVSQEQDSENITITGLSMTDDNEMLRTQIITGLLIMLGCAILAWILGRSLVRSSLAPLERVSDTARRVAALPLSSGEVTIEERVGEKDLKSSEEVGQVGGALNTLLDEVESALSARQRSEMQVRQFVADASHELRTPLASIRGYTELVQRKAAVAQLPEEATHALGRVESESIRMTGLVEDLLLLARLDAGRELEQKEVDLVGIVLDAVSDAQAAGGDHNWEISLPMLDDVEEDFEMEPPLVLGDDARLRQVLVNLLANARVHTPAGTTVTTTLRREGDALEVTVADNGPGITPEMQSRLFERFTRGDSSRERSTGSTGLGMSIALAVVKAHRGTLTVDSSLAEMDEEGNVLTPGHTVFTVRLPAL